MTPQEKLNELVHAYNQAEQTMVDYALEHNLDLYIDGKGSLLLEDYDSNWISKARGEWYTSTDSCS